MQVQGEGRHLFATGQGSACREAVVADICQITCVCARNISNERVVGAVEPSLFAPEYLLLGRTVPATTGRGTCCT